MCMLHQCCCACTAAHVARLESNRLLKQASSASQGDRQGRAGGQAGQGRETGRAGQGDRQGRAGRQAGQGRETGRATT